MHPVDGFLIVEFCNKEFINIFPNNRKLSKVHVSFEREIQQDIDDV